MAPPRTRAGRATHSARALTLAALTAVTVIVPLSGVFAPPQTPVAVAAAHQMVYPASMPNLVDVLSAAPVTHQVAVKVAEEVEPASKVTSPIALPSLLQGCDGTPNGTYVNGKLDSTQLCKLKFDPAQQLRPDAAVAMTELNAAYVANFGQNLCIQNSYRSLSNQYRSSAKYGFMAAQPGTSMHGLGLAVDLCSSVTNDAAAIGWLRKNAETFGWQNPPWAQRNNPAFQKYEPWHWEFVPGTAALANK